MPCHTTKWYKRLIGPLSAEELVLTSAWLATHCRFAIYSTDLGMLRDYLKGGTSPYDFPHLLEEFYETHGGLPKGFVDGSDYLEKMAPKELDEFTKWIESSGKAHENADALTPSYVHMEYKTTTPRTGWLVHFTNDPGAIAGGGFKHGMEDMATLGLTTHFVRRGQGSGWNFAFPIPSRDASKAANNYKYGKHAVMFQSAGVKVWHHGDEENQVIFWGPSATGMIPLYNDDGTWSVMDKRTDRVIMSGDFDKVTSWVMSNQAQYVKVL